MPCAYIQTKEKVYGPIFGVGRDYIQGHIFGRKITSICNLQSVKLTYLLIYGDVCIWDANWVTYLGRIFGGAYQQHFTV